MHASEQIGGRCVGHDVPRSCQADEVSPLSAVAFRGAGMRGPQRRARHLTGRPSSQRVPVAIPVPGWGGRAPHQSRV
jgi:hypothetical protein